MKLTKYVMIYHSFKVPVGMTSSKATKLPKNFNIFAGIFIKPLIFREPIQHSLVLSDFSPSHEFYQHC